MSQGTATKVAFKKAATWGTNAPVGANDRCPFKSCGIKGDPSIIPNEDLNDSGVQESPDIGAVLVEGPLVIETDYTQVPHMLLAAAMMGSAGAPTLVEAGVERHRFPWNADIDGLFLSMGIDYAVDAEGFASIKPESRTIVVQPSGQVEETYEFVGTVLDRSGTIQTAMDATTYRDDPRNGGRRRLLQRQATVRANAASGSALGSGDVQGMVGMSINMSRGLARAFGNAGALIEPPRDGWGEVGLTIEFFNATAALLALWRDAFHAKTPMKVDAVFDHGTLLGATANRTREFYFPKLIVTGAPLEIPGPGNINFQVTASAHPAASTPTGFTAGDTQPVIEYAQNEYATDVLA